MRRAIPTTTAVTGSLRAGRVQRLKNGLVFIPGQGWADALPEHPRTTMWIRKARIRRRFFRHFCALTTIVCVGGCGRDIQQQSGAPEADSLDKTFTGILESDWNYYIREKIFLGPTYYGNSTTFGRHGTSLHALALLSD